MKSIICISIALCALICTPQSQAQESKLDVFDKTLLSIFLSNNLKVLCLISGTTHPMVKKMVEYHLRGSENNTESPTPDEIAKAAYTLFPCPFSPFRSELRPATAKDIEGVWLFPKSSQRLRHGPLSPAWKEQAITPISCEAIAYYPGGEQRVARIVGQMECPFSSAKDMDFTRINPIVATWSFNKSGRINVDRTDISDHIEEWEAYLVTTDFSFASYSFKKGDLLAYLRREPGNEYLAATYFRHLQRLP